MEQKEFFIHNDIISVLTPKAVLVALALNVINYKNNRQIEYISVNRICFELGLSFDKSNQSQIKQGLKDLERSKLIDILQIINSNEFVVSIDRRIANRSKGYFTKISEDELRLIMGSDFQFDKKVGILKYFIAVLSTFNNSGSLPEKYKGKISSMPLSYICEVADISEKSANRYNESLEELKVLYIYRSTEINHDEKGQISQPTNVYSRYGDSMICDEFARSREEHYHADSKVKKEKSDENRSLAQKFKQLQKGKEYDEETMKKIEKYVKDRNKKYADEIATGYREAMVMPEKKDVSDLFAYMCEEPKEESKEEIDERSKTEQAKPYKRNDDNDEFLRELNERIENENNNEPCESETVEIFMRMNNNF